MIHHKQGRYDIKAKVKIQSPIPTSLYTIPNSHVKKMQGGGFVYLLSLFYHTYLVCILFGVSSLHFLHFQCFIFLFLYFLCYFVSYNVNSNVSFENIQGLIWLIRATVKPLLTDPSKSRQPLYSGPLTCLQLILTQN